MQAADSLPRRYEPAVSALEADQDAAQLLVARLGRLAPGAAGGAGSVSGLTLAQAEGLLDWLQNRGCTNLRAALGTQGVTVSCACPPGLRLARDARGDVGLLER